MTFVLSVLFSLSAQALEIKLQKEPKPVKQKLDWTKPAVLDARGSFAYATSHAENTYLARWEDFSLSEESRKGVLDSNFGGAASKLRVLGVHPDREIIVLGQGTKGWGEEGRIAWMLKYFGFSKVLIQNFSDFPGKRVTGGQELTKTVAAPVWLVKPVDSIRISRSELRKRIDDKSDFALIDVRAALEFQGTVKYGEKKGHIPGSINIPWTDFVGTNGIPKTADQVKEMLKSKNIPLEKEIVFVCSIGVRSAYATFAALNSGLNAKNYDGGLSDWMSDDTSPVLED